MLPWSFEKEKWEQCSLQQTLLCHPSFTQSTWPFHMHWPLLGTPSPLSMALYLREIRWHWVSNESSTAASSLSAWAVRCSAVAWHCFPSPLESGIERAGRDGTVLDENSAQNRSVLPYKQFALTEMRSSWKMRRLLSSLSTLSAQCGGHWCLIQLQAATIILLLEGAEKSTVLPKGIWDLQLRIKGLQRYKEDLSGFKTKCGRGIERECEREIKTERARERKVLLANHFEPSLRFMKSVCHEVDDLSLGNWNQY